MHTHFKSCLRFYFRVKNLKLYVKCHLSLFGILIDNMIAAILITLVLGYIGYLCIKPYLSPLRHIPEPPSWPILHQLPYLAGNIDFIDVFEEWAQMFKDDGLFKMDNIFGKYILFK